MADPLQRSLRDLRRRARLASWLGEWSLHLFVALVAAGAAALLARFVFELSAEQAAWALAVVAVTPFSAFARARRRFMSAAGTAAWLDVRAGATGLVVTEVEALDERWAGRAERLLASAPHAPRLRLQPLASRSFAGIAFALLALWVDIPARVTGPEPELYENTLADLREKLDTLKEQLDVGAEAEADLEARLERLEAEVQEGHDAEATFEALDQLQQRLAEQAIEAQEAAARAFEALQDAVASAGQDASRAQEALEETLSKLVQEGLAKDLPTALSEKLGASLEIPPGAQFDLSELKQLSADLRQMLEGKLSELAAAGLLKPGELGELLDASELGELVLHECDEDCKKEGGT